MPGLFRNEVLQTRQATAFGQVVLRPPLSFSAWCVAAAAVCAALAPAELPPRLALPGPAESLDRITVRLAAPHVMAYGHAQPPTVGMQLEADVMLDRRRRIEWVFEPLVALGRRA